MAASTRGVTEIPIIPLSRLDLRFEPAPWPFADERRTEINAHFAKLRAAKPEMWNGRVLLLRRGEIADDVLSGAYSEVDFASFIAWRDWGFPDTSARNCFAMAALRSSDGAFLLGEMGAHTATAGQIYFAAGTPDRQDLVGDTVDLERGVMRELAEETGLVPPEVSPQAGWTAVLHGQRIALMKIVDAPASADELAKRTRAFLASQQQPELADIHIVRSVSDLRPAMPRFVTAFLESHLR
ncbi:MAG: NUDIX hydrolase [Alphaproteobacteria bacterium]